MGDVRRFVLNHLPQRLTAVDILIASARPGGVILVEDLLPWALQRFADQAPSDEDAQALLRFEAARLGVLAKHGNDRYWSVRAGEVFKRRGLIDVDVQESSGAWHGGDPGCRTLRAALRQLFDELLAEGVKADDLQRVADLLQDTRVMVNAHVVVSVRARRRAGREPANRAG